MAAIVIVTIAGVWNCRDFSSDSKYDTKKSRETNDSERSSVERTFIISRRKGENITIRIQNSAHLGHSVEMNEKGWGVKLARLTAGGISVAVASEIQITPF